MSHINHPENAIVCVSTETLDALHQVARALDNLQDTIGPDLAVLATVRVERQGETIVHQGLREDGTLTVFGKPTPEQHAQVWGEQL